MLKFREGSNRPSHHNWILDMQDFVRKEIPANLRVYPTSKQGVQLGDEARRVVPVKALIYRAQCEIAVPGCFLQNHTAKYRSQVTDSFLRTKLPRRRSLRLGRLSRRNLELEHRVIGPWLTVRNPLTSHPSNVR